MPGGQCDDEAGVPELPPHYLPREADLAGSKNPFQTSSGAGSGSGFKARTGLIIEFMSPACFTPEKQCYSVLSLHFFRKVVIHARETIQRKQLRDRQLSSGVRSESGIALGGESTDPAKAATDFTDFVLGGEPR